MKRNKQQTLEFTLELMNYAHSYIKSTPTATIKSLFESMRKKYDGKFYYTIPRDIVDCGYVKLTKLDTLKLVSKRPFKMADAEAVNAYIVSRAKYRALARKNGIKPTYKKLGENGIVPFQLPATGPEISVSQAIELLKKNGYKVMKQDWITL